MFHKLDKILTKYTYNYKKNVNILTDNNHIIIDDIKKSYEVTLNNPNSDHIIIMIYGNKKYTDQQIKGINKELKKDKIIILLVHLKFEFDHLVKSVIANNIDVTSFRENGEKCEYYFILLRKD